jgi:hypothetical protein
MKTTNSENKLVLVFNNLNTPSVQVNTACCEGFSLKLLPQDEYDADVETRKRILNSVISYARSLSW